MQRSWKRARSQETVEKTLVYQCRLCRYSQLEYDFNKDFKRRTCPMEIVAGE